MTKTILNSDRMKKENPMFNKDTSKKVHETLRLKYQKEVHPNKGRKRPDLTLSNLTNNPMKNPESIRKMVEKNTGKHIWENRNHPRGMLNKSHPRKGTKIHSQEHIDFLKESMKGGGNHFYNRHHTDETRRKLREINLELLNDEEFVKKKFDAQSLKPNKPEIFLSNLIKQNNLPFHYVGDGQLIIGGRCPDFTCNPSKKVILLHGDWWHYYRLKRSNPLITRLQVEEEDREHYRKLFFDCLVIWEHELKNPTQVISKINNFLKGGLNGKETL